MKFIFIAYADSGMAYSLKAIGCQAEKLGFFDEVILYTPEDLPEAVRNSPLMKFKYGGGYWAWKPWIIDHTLKTHDEGDVVCYVDAGCSLNRTSEWYVYMELMDRFDTMVFRYPDDVPVWEKYGGSSTKIKHWVKKSAMEYYDTITGGMEWRECHKILGGFLWFKGKHNPIVEEWLNIVVYHPEIIDDSGVLENQPDFFWRHKHDQPALTALTYKYGSSCMIMPELLDGGPDNAAVVATRIRAANCMEYIVCRTKMTLRSVLGEKMISVMKKALKK